jgi:hypothetical protein
MADPLSGILTEDGTIRQDLRLNRSPLEQRLAATLKISLEADA